MNLHLPKPKTLSSSLSRNQRKAAGHNASRLCGRGGGNNTLAFRPPTSRGSDDSSQQHGSGTDFSSNDNPHCKKGGGSNATTCVPSETRAETGLPPLDHRSLLSTHPASGKAGFSRNGTQAEAGISALALESATPSAAPSAAPAHFSEHQIAEAQRRQDLLTQLAQLENKGFSLNRAAKALGEPAANLSRYRRQYAAGGFDALIPKTDRCGRQPLATLDEEELKEAKNLFLQTGSKTAALRMLASSSGTIREEVIAASRGVSRAV